jgi:hypothetical protein
MIVIILCVSTGRRTEKKESQASFCLALFFGLVLGLSGQPYLGQPSAFTSLSGSGFTFFTAGGMAWLFLGTR